MFSLAVVKNGILTGCAGPGSVEKRAAFSQRLSIVPP